MRHFAFLAFLEMGYLLLQDACWVIVPGPALFILRTACFVYLCRSLSVHGYACMEAMPNVDKSAYTSVMSTTLSRLIAEKLAIPNYAVLFAYCVLDVAHLDLQDNRKGRVYFGSEMPHLAFGSPDSLAFEDTNNVAHLE